MAKVLSSISGNLISAASAGFAPTNSADVSAIASAYQVVSATGTQLYAGTAYVTSINSAPLSASRAGNAANASLANSAWYDGTGRLISSLPDSATVSAIAESYAESAASGKLDTTAQVVTSTAGDGVYVTAINGMGISGEGGGGAQVVTATGSASANAGSPFFPIITYFVSSINGSALLPYGYSALSGNSANWTNARTVVTANSANWDSVYNTVSSNSASWDGGATTGDYVEQSALEVTIGSANNAGDIAFAQGSGNSANYRSFAQGSQNTATAWSVAIGGSNTARSTGAAFGVSNTAFSTSIAVGRKNYASGESLCVGVENTATRVSVALGQHNTAKNTAFSYGRYVSSQNTAFAIGNYNLKGNGDTTTGDSAAFVIGDGTGTAARHDLMLVTKDGEITMYSSTADTVGTGIMSSIRAISAAATGATVSLPITGSAGDNSASYGAGSLEFTRYDTAGEPDIRTAMLSPDSLWMDYTLDGNDHTSMTLNESMLDFGDSDGDHIVDAYSIDSWNSAVDTVANNSASWGQGGVDSATVSAIASAYQVVSSTASGSGEIFGQTAYYATEINGLTLSAQEAALANYATNAGSAGAAPTNSSEVSAIASGYASGKADASALSSYALSADVSSTIDLVSAQSANWGGSALALSAGPGVKLEKVGNTLVASTDETVLWSGSGNAFTTPEPLTNFSEIKFHIKSHPSANVGEVVVPMVDNNRTAIKLSWVDEWSKGSDWLGGLSWWSNLNNTGMTSFGIGDTYYMGLRNATTVGCGSYGSNLYVLDVIGINRTAGV